MVAFELKPSFAFASCCRVDVVNGAPGLRLPGDLLMSDTLKDAPLRPSKNSWASASVSKRLLSSALNSWPS